MAQLDPEKQREFALEIVRRLREAGFEAYWVGGCVRDILRGVPPRDYDVATNARPKQVRRILGWKRTIPVGQAFGVILVRGPKGAGEVEVATFREDDTYSDGRHPDRVHFSDARHDALRRDFTINAMFYDPLTDHTLDYVGGEHDLKSRIIRTVGDPHQRFAEDRLRMLRAVRFAAALDFEIDGQTFEAIKQHAAKITEVSPERIAVELELALKNGSRARAVRLLLESGLLEALLPELVPRSPEQQEQFEKNLAVLSRLEDPHFGTCLAVLFNGFVQQSQIRQIARRLRLSNEVAEIAAWLLENYDRLDGAEAKPWSQVQPILIAKHAGELVKVLAARVGAGQARAEDLTWVQQKLRLPPEELNPPPLITGDDLIALGIPRGPIYRYLLQEVRNAQLDGQVSSKQEALELVRKLAEQSDKYTGQ